MTQSDLVKFKPEQLTHSLLSKLGNAMVTNAIGGARQGTYGIKSSGHRAAAIDIIIAQ